MDETITLEVELRAFVRKETKKRWSAVCPSLGVASQSDSLAAAKRCLDEAVRLWFESCIERGVLERALQEVNFRPLPYGQAPPPGVEHVSVTRVPEEDVRGDAFNIRVEIPAYQASALLSAGL